MTRSPIAADSRFLCSGLVRLHVLHHAAREPVFGAAMIEELARHGYRLSAGTLYPILHALQRRGLVSSRVLRVGQTRRRVYRATVRGHQALAAAMVQVGDFFHELIELPAAAAAQ